MSSQVKIGQTVYNITETNHGAPGVTFRTIQDGDWKKLLVHNALLNTWTLWSAHLGCKPEAVGLPKFVQPEFLIA